MDFIPEKSELQIENINLNDKDVKDMIKELGIRKMIPGLKKKDWNF